MPRVHAPRGGDDAESSGRPSRLEDPRLVPLLAAVALGFLLACVQLLPTWELKQLSQREEVGAHHDPGYGHLPPWYLTQVVAPWWWYPADLDPDQALQSIRVLSIDSNTNKVEAHLYFGLLPLLFIVMRLYRSLWGGVRLDRRHASLLLLGVLATVYATGWLLPLTRQLPGFSFFMGPGRYGIVSTLAAAVLAGSGADLWLSRRRGGTRSVLLLMVLAVTLADLWWVSRRVTYATMVPDPPLAHRSASEVGRVLRQSPRLVRMWAPGANLASLTGFNTVPVYLGLGPAAYYDPRLMLNTLDAVAAGPDNDTVDDERQSWLQRAAVTHLLSMVPLDAAAWPAARLIWQGFDPLLSPAWARFQEPLYLYELPQSRARVSLKNPQPGDDAQLMRHESNRVVVEVTTGQGGRLVLADLNYPGWSATCGGNELEQLPVEPPFRVVDVPPGRQVVEWTFRPTSVRLGAWLSAAGVLVWSVWLVLAPAPAHRLTLLRPAQLPVHHRQNEPEQNPDSQRRQEMRRLQKMIRARGCRGTMPRMSRSHTAGGEHQNGAGNGMSQSCCCHVGCHRVDPSGVGMNWRAKFSSSRRPIC